MITQRAQASRRRRGQTLIIALIVLGVLLVIGFVFLGVVSRSLQASAHGQARSVSYELAEAGIRFAHTQMLTSQRGADWHPLSTPLDPVSPQTDPDYDLLRPAAGPSNPTDLGGPDHLGPYSRVNFEHGRSLIRVRYGPSDIELFRSPSLTPLRNPAKARAYLMIESVGRAGPANIKDPTQKARGAVSLVDEKKLIGIVPIGIIESARFITNKYRVSRFAELGMPHELGQLYTDGGVTVNPAEKVPMVLGSPGLKPYNFYANPPTTNTIDVPQGASIYSNADLRFHSKVTLNLARPFGEGVFIAGTVVGADENAAVTLRISDVLSGVWQPPTTVTLVNTVAPSLDSRSNDFDTLGGLIRDGQPETDPEGFARAVGRKEPPSILSIDPNTGRNRYEELTRESGKLVGGGNDGRFGHGQGPYVDNLSDRQTRSDENGRIDVGAAESLQYDWLNPNNGQANSGWQGQYYVPRAAYLQLFSDGFTITRDSRDPAAERTWKNPDGSDTGNSACRFKVGKVGAGTAADPYRLNVVNSFTPGIDIDNPDYTLGQPFNGVVYFEGNVRVRGVIPTDVQMSVVSGATIYIEGSITKGVVGNDWSGNPNMLLERRSNSCLALLAKDYVAINTTQFFGPNVRQQVEEAKTTTTPGYDPIRMRVPSGMLRMIGEFLLNPDESGVSGGSLSDPRNWRPYLPSLFAGDTAVLGYQDARPDAGNINQPLYPWMLLTHATDEGPAPMSLISLNSNGGNTWDPAYLFPSSDTDNGAVPYFPGPPAGIPMYGIGTQSWQRFPKFETKGFALDAPGATYTQASLTEDPLVNLTSGTNPPGAYSLFVENPNDFTIFPNSLEGVSTNDYLLARSAIVPHDIRIEAIMFAEEGSFFVIPGPPFNPNPNDRRDTYETNVGAVGAPEANRIRRENFGANPESPFYGEPLDVRIQIVGAISENMPPPISQQGEWLKRWGWIPRKLGSTGHYIPLQHVPTGFDVNGTDLVVPNLIVSYDPVLATGRQNGFDTTSSPSPYIRVDDLGRPLPPAPRLPVSPTLVYFGEARP